MPSTHKHTTLHHKCLTPGCPGSCDVIFVLLLLLLLPCLLHVYYMPLRSHAQRIAQRCSAFSHQEAAELVIYDHKLLSCKGWGVHALSPVRWFACSAAGNECLV